MVLIVDENHEVFTFGNIDKIMEERHENELITVREYSSWRGCPWSNEERN